MKDTGVTSNNRKIPQKILSAKLIKELGLEVIAENIFHKQVDYPFSYNHCSILITEGHYLTIIVNEYDSPNPRRERDIVDMLYIPDEAFLIAVLSKLFHLQAIFPKLYL